MDKQRRIFFYDGVQYRIHGNHDLCIAHLYDLRSHVKRLEMSNVNHLPVLSSQKYFDDGTQASFIFLYGNKIVNVIAPSVSVIKEDVDSSFVIVPMIRSKDSNYFVACMSGTFDGPYFLFKKTAEITASQFEEENEKEIDMQLISTECVSFPGYSMFIISQTGSLTAELVDWNNYTDYNLSRDVDEVSRYVVICDYSDHRTGGVFIDYYGVYDLRNIRRPKLYGSPINLPYLSYTYKREIDKVYSFFSVSSSNKDLITESYVWSQFESSGITPSVDINQFFGTWSSTYQMKDIEHGIRNTSWCYPYMTWESLRVEENNINNLAFAYLETIEDWNGILTRDPDVCNVVSGYTTNVSYTLKYTDIFMVNENKYKIGETRVGDDSYSMSYPYLEHKGINNIKYYGKNSPGFLTGLLSVKRMTEEGYDKAIYCYVGPNNKNEITVTYFDANSESGEHFIPEMKDENGDDIVFDGYVHLVLIKNLSESK